MEYLFFYLFLFLIGSSIGSFLNVLRFRLPKSFSIIKPRSFCPKCNTSIPFYLNIPILSWILLRGKCIFCKSKIPFSYPLIELFTALLFVLNGFLSLNYPSDNKLNLVGLNIFTGFLIIISLIDFDKMIIPNKLILVGSLLGLIFNFTFFYLLGNQSLLVFLNKFLLLPFIGAFCLEILNFIFSLIIKKDAFGFGDVKYLFMLGTWIGLKGQFSSFILSIYIGGLITLFLIILKKISKKGKIPFGPYLSISAYFVAIFGSENIFLFFKRIYSLG